jgi:hypothetical protein
MLDQRRTAGFPIYTGHLMQHRATRTVPYIANLPEVSLEGTVSATALELAEVPADPG